jgi:hypothetical protein
MPRVLTPEQKERSRAAAARYREKNREKIRAKRKADYWAHKDDPEVIARNKERFKAYYEANKDRMHETHSAWRKTEQGRISQALAYKKYRENNLEKRKAEDAEYRSKHSARIHAQNTIRRLTGLRTKDTPPALIESGEMLIQIKRLTKCR